ncbi:MAG: hypothetical protein HFE76_03175 [Firmicutes bacterium]|nr:hypothetical protein [Bacillota bacterium]
MLIAEYSYEKDIEVKQREAWQEGRQKGKQEAEERMVLRLHQKGFPLEQIAELTERKEEEVRKVLLEKDVH